MNLIAGIPASLFPSRFLMMIVVGFVVQNSFFPGLYYGGWVAAVTTLWVVMAVLPGAAVGYHISLGRD